MKKLLCCFVSVIFLFVFVGCSIDSTTGKNVEIEKFGTDDTYVCYYMECPNCGHKAFTGKEINKGESYKNTTICNNCGEMFEYSIQR